MRPIELSEGRSLLLVAIASLLLAACAPATSGSSGASPLTEFASALAEPTAGRTSDDRRVVCGGADSVSSCLAAVAAGRDSEASEAPATSKGGEAQGSPLSSIWDNEEPPTEASLAVIASFNGGYHLPVQNGVPGAVPAQEASGLAESVGLPSHDTALLMVESEVGLAARNGSCTNNMHHIALRFPLTSSATLSDFRRTAVESDTCAVIENALAQGLDIRDLEAEIERAIADTRDRLAESQRAYDEVVDQTIEGMSIADGRYALDRCTNVGADCLLGGFIEPYTTNSVVTAWTLVVLEEQLKQVRTYL